MHGGLPGGLHPPDAGGAGTSTTANQLYIDPDECIDCDACVEVCPVDAIIARGRRAAGVGALHELNAAYFRNGSR